MIKLIFQLNSKYFYNYFTLFYLKSLEFLLISDWVARFVISCAVQFLIYYINFGVLPIIFEKLKMNEEKLVRRKIPIKKQKTSHLFSTSMFAQLKEDPHEEDLPSGGDNEQLYKECVIVNEVETKKDDVNFSNLLHNINENNN